MSDISTTDRLSCDIFEQIITKGPSTVYDIHKNTRIPLPTIHRHLKGMENNGVVKIYKKEKHKSGQEKKFYGPTAFGLAEFCYLDGKFFKKIESSFEKWISEAPFYKQLTTEAIGLDEDEIANNPEAAKNHLKIYLELYVEANNALDQKEEIPLDLLITIGELLLARRNPKKYELYIKELYNHVPGFRKSIEKRFSDNAGFLDSLKESQ